MVPAKEQLRAVFTIGKSEWVCGIGRDEDWMRTCDDSMNLVHVREHIHPNLLKLIPMLLLFRPKT